MSKHWARVWPPYLLIALVCLGLGACVPPRRVAQAPVAPAPPPAPPAVEETPALRLVPPEKWPDLADDLDARTLEKAANNSIAYLRGLEEHLFHVGDRTVGTQLLIDTLQELVAAKHEAKDGTDLSARLKADFDLYQVSFSTYPAEVTFSSYYQPTFPARLKRTGEFKYPIYRKPSDLVTVQLGAFNERWRGETIVGRVDKSGAFVPYFSRRDIDVRKQLEGRKLEIAWLNNQFDRLMLHIQGSGILVFSDGRQMLAQYSASNDRPYNSVGLALVGSGVMNREEISHEKIRQYLKDHPEGEGWLLSRDPRYTFFRLTELPKDGEPFGTLEKPLVAGRSIAIDPKFLPLGAAVYAQFPLVQADAEGHLLGKSPLKRFLFCQDTGGAIKGSTRVDFYAGHGPQAKATAQNVWDKGTLYLLIKRLPPRQR